MVKLTRKNILKKCNYSRKSKRIVILPRHDTFQKKVAILIIGRIKGYTYVEKQLLKLQKMYNAKIFCSINKKNKSEYINKFCSVFNIKDEQLNLEFTPNPPEFMYKLRQSAPIVISNMYSCLFHKQRCFDLLEKYQKKYNNNFDYVIYYRADIDNKQDFILHTLEPNTIYIPAYSDQNSRNIETDGINDQIAYGSYEIMKKYLSSLFSLEKISLQYNILYHPELFLKKYLIDENKISVKIFPFNYELHEGRTEPLAEYDNFE